LTIRNILLLILIVGVNEITYAQSDAPQFILPDWESNQISLNQFKGKVILLNFWGTGCTGEKYYNWLKALSHKLKNYDDIVFINIATRSDYNKWIRLVSNGTPAGINLWDKDKVNEGLYRVSEYPYSFVISKSGKILGRDPEQDMLDYVLIRARKDVNTRTALNELKRNVRNPEKDENVFKYIQERYKFEQDPTYSYSVL
jgi:thiol-disulfide isomerase/thioredoxin